MRELTREEEMQLGHLFSYHAPTTETIPKYNDIRRAGLEFATMIFKCVPACPDRTAALRKIREAVMTANAAIALDGRS